VEPVGFEVGELAWDECKNQPAILAQTVREGRSSTFGRRTEMGEALYCYLLSRFASGNLWPWLWS